jgi:hypothetical protein
MINPVIEFFERIKSLDPLSGPNVLRRANQQCTENADGSMTMRFSRRPLTLKQVPLPVNPKDPDA